MTGLGPEALVSSKRCRCSFPLLSVSGREFPEILLPHRSKTQSRSSSEKKKNSVTMSSETAPPLIAAQLNHMLLNFPHLSKVMRFNPIFATKLRGYGLVSS